MGAILDKLGAFYRTSAVTAVYFNKTRMYELADDLVRAIRASSGKWRVASVLCVLCSVFCVLYSCFVSDSVVGQVCSCCCFVVSVSCACGFIDICAGAHDD